MIRFIAPYLLAAFTLAFALSVIAIFIIFALGPGYLP